MNRDDFITQEELDRHFGEERPQVEVHPVEFTPLLDGQAQSGAESISLLLDVALQLTVELGRSSMLIKDVLALGTGTVVELDRLAGEPVDILVNSMLIARGEVVVVDEKFGVRVTEVVSPAKRIASLS